MNANTMIVLRTDTFLDVMLTRLPNLTLLWGRAKARAMDDIAAFVIDRPDEPGIRAIQPDHAIRNCANVLFIGINSACESL